MVYSNTEGLLWKMSMINPVTCLCALRWSTVKHNGAFKVQTFSGFQFYTLSKTLIARRVMQLHLRIKSGGGNGVYIPPLLREGDGLYKYPLLFEENNTFLINHLLVMFTKSISYNLKEKLPQAFMQIEWMENDFINLTAKVWANWMIQSRDMIFQSFG